MAAERNLDIYQGDSYTHLVNITNSAGSAVDVSARTYASQLRRYPSSTASTAFSVSMTNAAAGQVAFSLTAIQTAALEPGVYHYDVQETNGGAVLTLLAGEAEVSAEVTR